MFTLPIPKERFTLSAFLVLFFFCVALLKGQQTGNVCSRAFELKPLESAYKLGIEIPLASFSTGSAASSSPQKIWIKLPGADYRKLALHYFIYKSASVRFFVYKGENCSALSLVQEFRSLAQDSAFNITATAPNVQHWLAIEIENGSSDNAIALQCAMETNAVRKSLPLLLPFSTDCNNATCLTGTQQTNQNILCTVPQCGWQAPGGCWTTTEGILFYKFATFDNSGVTSLSFLNATCGSASGFLQVALYSSCNGNGGGGTLLSAPVCGKLNDQILNTNLPPGVYILAVDGNDGTVCDWRFTGSALTPLKVNAPTSIQCGDPLPFTSSGGVNGMTYNWDGPNFPATEKNKQNPVIPAANLSNNGVYTLTVTVNGCVYTATHTVEVLNNLPPPTVTSNQPVPCGDALNLTVIHSLPPPPGSTFSWVGPNGWTSNQPNPTRPGGANIAGPYFLTVTYPSGCTTNAAHVVNVAPPNNLQATLTYNAPLQCGQQLCITATPIGGAFPPGTVFNWTGPSGQVPPVGGTTWNQTTNTPTVCRNPGVYGPYFVNIVLPNGCAFDGGPVDVIDPAPGQALLNDNKIQCGRPLCLTATNIEPGATNFRWYGPMPPPAAPDAYWQSNQLNPCRNPAVPGIYSFVYNVGNCPKVLPFFLADEKPNIQISASPVFCGQNLTLTASGVPNAVYTWQGPVGSGLNAPPATGPIVTDNSPKTGFYTATATVTEGGNTYTCKDSVIVSADYIPPPIVSVQGNKCGQTLQLSASSNPPVTYTSYDWSCFSGPGGPNLNSANAVVTVPFVDISYTGLCTLRVTMPGCSTLTPFFLNIMPMDPPKLDPFNYVCVGDTLMLKAKPVAGASFKWEYLDGPWSIDSIIAYRPNMVSELKGDYKVTMTIGSCVSDTTIFVDVRPTPDPPTLLMTNTPVCQGDTLLLFTNKKDGASAYHWRGPNAWAVSSLDTFAVRANAQIVYSGVYSVSVTVLGCTSQPTPGTAAVFPLPGPPTATAKAICGPGTPIFTAVMGTPTGTGIRLYTSAVAAAPEATVSSAPFWIQTPGIISAPQTFYIESFNDTTQCRSPRVPVVAPVYPAIPAPTVNEVRRCGPGAVTLSATVTGGYLIRWYDSQAASQPIQTGVSLSVSNLMQTTTYYVAAYNPNADCETPKVEVVAWVDPIPLAPVSNSAYYRCGPGVITLSATVGQGGHIVRWLLGSSILGQGTPFEYQLNQTGTINLVSVDTVSGCQSSFFTAALNIIPIPAPPTVASLQSCGPGLFVFTALMTSPSGVGIRVYDSPVSTTHIADLTAPPYHFQASFLSLTTSFYFEAYNTMPPSSLECPSARVMTVATVKPLPAPPTAANQSICGPGAVVVPIQTGIPAPTSVTVAPAGSLNTVTTLSASPFSFASDAITQTTTFVITAWLDGCSTSSDFVVVVNPLPGQVSAPPVTRCGAGMITINAGTSGAPVPQVDFLLASGSPPLQSSQTQPYIFQVNVLATTTFYLQGVNPITGCKSALSPVLVTVHALPELPTTFPVQRCGPGSVQFSFLYTQKPNEYLRLFQAGNNNTLANYFAPPYVYTTPHLAASTTYYLQAIHQETGCVNPTLAAAPVTIHRLPGIPEMTGQARCGPGNLLINPGEVTPEADRARLYAEFTSTEVLAENGTPPFYLLTPEISVTTTFYVAYYNSQTGCESGREPVVATVHPIPATPAPLQLRRCGTGSVSFTVTPGAPAGNVFELLQGANLIAQANNAPYVLQTPLISEPGDVFELTLKNTITGCQSVKAPVNVIVYPQVPQPNAIGGKICGSGTALITGVSAANGLRTHLKTANGQLIESSLLQQFGFYTPFITQTTAFQVVAENEITGCESAPLWVNVEVLPLPASPTIAPAMRCGGGPVTITPIMAQGTYNVSISCDGSQPYNSTLSIGVCGSAEHCNVITLPNVNESKRCQLRVTDPITGCAALAPAPFEIIIHPLPEKPLATAIGQCETRRGEILALEPNQKKYRISLWDANHDFITSQLGPGVSFRTPFIAQTTQYYITSTDTLTGCESDKASVLVPVINTPEAPELGPFSRCGTGSLTFTAAPGLAFFTSATEPNSFFLTTTELNAVVTPSFNRNTQIFVARIGIEGCSSARKPITINVFTPPFPPEPISLQRCGPGVFTFISPYPDPTNHTFALYHTLAATEPIATATSAPWQVATDFISQSAVYYMKAKDKATGCESSAAPLRLTILPEPAPPLVSSVARCGVGTVTFSVTSASGVELWDAPQGGNKLAQDYTAPFTLVTPILNTSSVFYVQAVQAGCASLRVPVTATVSPMPATPLVTSVARCGTGSVTFTLTGDMGIEQIEIEDVNRQPVSPQLTQQNGSIIFATPFLNQSSVFYFRTQDLASGCRSSWSRAEVLLHPLPATPQPKPYIDCIMPGSSLAIPFTYPASPVKIRLWNENDALVQTIQNEPYVFSLTLSPGSYTYYVSVENLATGCTTPKVPWTIVLHPMPQAPPLVGSRCGAGAMEVIAQGAPFMRAYLFSTVQATSVAQTLMQLPAAFQFPNVSENAQYFYRLEDTQTGCKSNVAPIDLKIHPVPFIPSVPVVEELCAGGETSLKILAPFPGLTYRWSGPNGFTAQGVEVPLPSVTTAQSGFYLATAQNEFGCVSAPSAFELRVWALPPVPIPTFYNVFLEETPLCVGQGLNLSVRFYESYPEGVQFEWDGPADFREPSHPFPGIEAVSLFNSGIYRVRAIYNSCTTTYGQVEVPIYPRPETPIILSNTPICLAGSPLELSLANPNEQYDYAWAGPNAFIANGVEHIRENIIQNAGVYSVVATSAMGCISDTGRLEVRFTPKVTFDLLPPKVSLCQGELLQFEVAGAEGLQYHFSGPNDWDTVTVFPQMRKGIARLADSGEYTIYAVAAGCTSESNVIPIVVRPLPPIPDIDGRTMVCPGGNLRLNVISPERNTAYLWRGPNGLSELGTTLNLSNNRNVQEGDYSVVAIQNGCTSAPRVEFIQRVDALPAPSVSGTIQVCEGETIALTASGYNNATYIWSGPASFSATGNAPTWENAPLYSAGIYSVYALTSEGCTSLRATYTVQVLPRPAPPIVEKIAPACVYESLRFSVLSRPGLSYAWNGPLDWSASGPAVVLDTYTTNQSGMYRVAAHADGCTSAPAFFAVSVKPRPTVSNFISPAPHCAGGTAELWAESEPGAVYHWKGPNNFELITTEGRAVLPILSAAASGMYSLQTVLAGCASDWAQTFITVQPLPLVAAVATNAPICEGQTLRLTANAPTGTHLLWLGPNGFNATGNLAQKNSIALPDQGVYSVTAVANGCTGQTRSVLVSVTAAAPPPVIQSSSNRCLGQQLFLTASSLLPNAQVYWQGPNNFTASGNSVSLLLTNLSQAGEYSAVQIVGGCTSEVAVLPIWLAEIPERPLLAANSPLCAGQTLNLEILDNLPSARYIWNGPNGFSSTQRLPSLANIQSAQAGTYTARIIANGCTSQTASIIVEVVSTPLQPRASASVNICEGQNLNLYGQASNASLYLWSGPNAFQSTQLSPILPNVTTGESGVYELIAINGICSSNAARVQVTIFPKPAPPLASAVASTVCTGQNVQLQASGAPGALYTWSGPNGFVSNQQNPVIQNVGTRQSGQYEVFATQGACRSAASTVLIRVVERPQTPRLTAPPQICQGSPLQLSGSLQPMVRYYWSGPLGWSFDTESNGITIDAPLTGSYSVVSYIQGCSSQMASAFVEVIPNPGLMGLQEKEICVGNAFASNVNPPSGYAYLWTGPSGFGATTPNIILASAQVQHAGRYTLTLSRQGCNFSYQEILLTVIEPPRFSLSSNSPICEGQTLSLTAAGSLGAFYLWSGPLGWSDSVPQPILPAATAARAGVYTAIAFMRGCTAEAQTLSVAVSPSPGPINIAQDGAVCPGQTIRLRASVLKEGVNIFWQGPNGFTALGSEVVLANAAISQAGIYTITANLGSCTTQTLAQVRILSPSQCGGSCQGAQQLRAASVGLNHIALQWQPSASAVCYVLQYGEAGTSEQSFTSILLPANTTSYIINHLEPGKNYVVRIRSNCSACQFQTGTFSSWQTLDASTAAAKGESVLSASRFIILSAYPNPNKGNFVLRAEGGVFMGALAIRLINLAGEVVATQNLLLEEEQTELSIFWGKQLPTPGVYALEVDFIEKGRKDRLKMIIY